MSCEWVLPGEIVVCLLPAALGKTIAEMVSILGIESSMIAHNWHTPVDLSTVLIVGMRINFLYSIKLKDNY